MELQLKGKRALITGSSSGIGEEIARTFAREGAAVVVHGRNSERTKAVATSIRTDGGEAAFVTGGLLEQADVESVAAEAIEVYGGIDILVNNAGGRPETGPSTWDEVSSTVWASCFALNVIAPAILASKVLPEMRRNDWGRLIQISSAQSYDPRPDTPEYGACKGAINTVTVSLSKNLEGTGVTANTISPGAIGTPALRAVMHSKASAMGWPEDPEELERVAVASRWPSTVGRLGKPGEIAAAVLLLASPLGGFITGANLRVDGGRTGVVI